MVEGLKDLVVSYAMIPALLSCFNLQLIVMCKLHILFGYLERVSYLPPLSLYPITPTSPCFLL